MSHKNVFFGAGNKFHSHSCAKPSQADSFMARSTCSFEWLSTFFCVRRDLADTGDVTNIHWMDKHIVPDIFPLDGCSTRHFDHWGQVVTTSRGPQGFFHSLVPLIFHQISDTLRSKPQSQRPRGRWDTLPTSNDHDINDKDSSRMAASIRLSKSTWHSQWLTSTWIMTNININVKRY